jgi:hypothetical protein
LIVTAQWVANKPPRGSEGVLETPKPSYFLMVVTDGAGKHSALDLAKRRLDQGLWPIYKGTRNRRAIAVGDILLIYLGGSKNWSQSVVASAKVKVIDEAGRRALPSIDSEDAQTNPPFKTLRLEDIQFFAEPVDIRHLLGKLSFLPNSRKWGAALVGGCRRMTRQDFLEIDRARK